MKFRLRSGIGAFCVLGFGMALGATKAKGSMELELVAEGLKQPVQAVVAPGEPNRLYLVEQAGRVMIHEGGDVLTKPFLDIRSKVVSGGEMGLLSLAFHPDYQKNKRYFLNYTARRPGLKTIIAEYKAGDAGEKVLLEIDQPYSNHNGGQSLFGPDGFLYIGTGDGGSANDPHNHSQNPNSLLGKMLRIDVSKPGNYASPADNPFAKGGGRPEIFATGLRNPWRYSFDRKTGALFAGDVGQNLWEEIDLVVRGGNYGWRIMEGKHCFNPSQNCKQAGLTLPIYEYPRSEGISVTGGYVYRGTKIPDLQGAYLYGDFQTGRLWSLRYDQATKKVGANDLVLKTGLLISSFGEDANGELLVVHYGGEVYRLIQK